MTDIVGFTFDGDASEAFADRLLEMKGWYVELTDKEGNRWDASIVGSGSDEEDADGNGWYDAVRWLPVDEYGEAIEDAKPTVTRVRNVHVY